MKNNKNMVLPKKIIILILGVFLIGVLAYIFKKNYMSSSKIEEEIANSVSNVKKKGQIKSLITTEVVENQLALPKKGEEIVVFKVKGYGEIKCRLFPKAAPVAVEMFKKAVREGKYNGDSFHRIVNDFMIQGGQKANKDEKGKETKVELNKSLHHFNGALCMARAQDLNKGQGLEFYIVSSNSGKTANLDEIKNKTNSSYKMQGLDVSVDFDEKTKKTYKERGGTPDLDMNYTVIGQTFSGQEFVDKIAKDSMEREKKEQEEMAKEAKEKQEIEGLMEDLQEKSKNKKKKKTKEDVIIEKVELKKA